MNLRRIAITLFFAFFLNTSISGQITVTGDYQPQYNGTDDPWNMGPFADFGITSLGELTVRNGSSILSSGAGGGTVRLGVQQGSEGRVLLADEGTSWNSAFTTLVGDGGVGRLDILSGAEAEMRAVWLGHLSSGVGFANVSGNGSLLDLGNGTATVGQEGTGTFHLSDGGEILGRSLLIGNGTGSIGEVHVSGAGSRWYLGTSSATLAVGFNGDGLLSIEDGGVLNSSQGGLSVGGGQNGSGLITVSGQGSKLVAQDVILGRASEGNLEVSNGGSVRFRNVEVGKGFEVPSSIRVTGAGSILSVNGLELGIDGYADLQVLDGGQLDVSWRIDLDLTTVPPAPTPTLALNNGRLRFLGDIGLMNINDGDFIWDSSAVINAKTINSNSTLFQNGGLLSPGLLADFGTTTINTDYEVESGTIRLDFGPELGHDSIEVFGEVDLLSSNSIADTNLDLSIFYGFGLDLAVGDTFTILSNDGSDPILGTFSNGDSIVVTYPSREFEFSIDYAGGDGNDIVLTVISFSIPEPAFATVLLLGSAILGYQRRR